MRWAEHVAYMGERRDFYIVLVRKPEGNKSLKMTRRRWETILRWTFRKWYVGARTGSMWLRIGTGGGLL
jgi:hypothetical protein